MNALSRIFTKLAPSERYWASIFFIFFCAALLPFGSGPQKVSFYLGIVFPALVFSTREEYRRLVGNPYLLLPVALCVYALLRSADPDAALSTLKALFTFLLLALGAMKVPTAQPAVVKRGALLFITALLIYVLANAIHQAMTQNWLPGQRLGKLFGGVENVIFCTALLVCALVVYSWACLRENDYRSLIIANAVVMTSAFWLMQSRTALPAWAGSMAILAACAIPPSDRRRVLPWLFLSMLAIGALGIPALLERGNSYRVEIWTHYLAEMRECGALFGCGWGLDRPFTTHDGSAIPHPHSIYVQHLFWGGFTGLALLLLTLLPPLIAGIRQAHFAAWALLPGCIALLFDGRGVITSNLNQRWFLAAVPLAFLIAGLTTQTATSTASGKNA